MTLNIKYFQNLTKQIEHVGSCDRLQELATEALSAVMAEQAAVQAQIDALQPILALLQPPTANLTAIVTWITDFVNGFLKPIVKPYEIYTVDLAAIAQQLADLQSAIQSAQLRFPSCNVSLPGV